MTITIIRPGQKVYTLPNFGINVTEGGVATAAGNWWEVSGKTCIAAYQPKGAADLAASYVNLANPGTYDAAPGTAPSWDVIAGWLFTAASSQYLTTGITPGSGYTILVRFSGGDSPALTARCVAGSNGAGATRFFLHPWHYSFSGAIWGGGGLYSTYGSAIAAGVMALANTACYLNGAGVGTTNAAWSGAGFGIYLGGRNTSGSPSEYWDGAVQAVAIYSDTLSGTEVATVSAAMAAL